jgi:hypothetical protein
MQESDAQDRTCRESPFTWRVLATLALPFLLARQMSAGLPTLPLRPRPTPMTLCTALWSIARAEIGDMSAVQSLRCSRESEQCDSTHTAGIEIRLRFGANRTNRV